MNTPGPEAAGRTARSDQALARLSERLTGEVDGARIVRGKHPDPVVAVSRILKILDDQPPDRAADLRALLAMALVRLAEVPAGRGLELAAGDEVAAGLLLVAAEAELDHHLDGCADLYEGRGMTDAGLFGCVLLALRTNASTSLLLGAAAIHRLARSKHVNDPA